MGGIILVYIKEKEIMAEVNFKKITVVENKFEADLISQTLQNEGIPVMIRSYHDTAYNGIFIPQKGWGAVMVPAEMEDKARIIIEELLRDLREQG
jgi:hypothetical protein